MLFRVDPRYVLFGLWAALCLWLLSTGFTTPAPVDVKDKHAGMSFWMMLLSFPSGLLVFIGADIATLPFGAYFSLAWKYHPWFYCLIWFCYFLIGAVQWLFFIFWTGRNKGGDQGEMH